MKKIFFSLAAMASLVLASCTGDYTDWASPQAYSQDEAAAKLGITFVAGPEANIVMPTEEDEVRIVEIQSENNNVAGCTVKSITINGEEIEATTSGRYIIVNANDLNSIIQKTYNSRASVARDYEVKTIVSINTIDGEAVTFDTEATVKGTFTPKPTPAVDPKGYYLLGDFQENGTKWDTTQPVWMTDNGDGTFTAIVNTVSEGDNWYMFYAGSYYESGNWESINQGEMGCAVNGDNALQNFIVYPGDDKKAETPVISGDGQWKIVLDMNNLVYTVTRQAVNYYIIGGPSNDWAGSAASRSVKFNQPNEDVPTYNVTFVGPAEGADMWFAIGDDKACDAIVDNDDWSKLFGTTNGNGNSGSEGSLARRSELNDDGSFKVTGPAKFIRVTIDMRAMTYTVQTLDFAEYIYVVGSVSGTEWNKSFPLWSANMDGNYQGYYYLNGEYKFKPNADNWDGDWEYDGDDRIADNGGGNCPGVDPGFYQIDVNLQSMTYAVTQVANITLVGSHNDWNPGDANMHMLFNEETQAWEKDITFANDANVKFAMNDNWSVSWGGVNGDPLSYDNLTQYNGKDLSVPAGSYKVELFLSYEGNNKVVFTAK